MSSFLKRRGCVDNVEHYEAKAISAQEADILKLNSQISALQERNRQLESQLKHSESVQSDTSAVWRKLSQKEAELVHYQNKLHETQGKLLQTEQQLHEMATELQDCMDELKESQTRCDQLEMSNRQTSTLQVIAVNIRLFMAAQTELQTLTVENTALQKGNEELRTRARELEHSLADSQQVCTVT